MFLKYLTIEKDIYLFIIVIFWSNPGIFSLENEQYHVEKYQYIFMKIKMKTLKILRIQSAIHRISIGNNI